MARGYGVRADELAAPLDLVGRVRELGLRALDLRLLRRDVGLERLALDGEKEGALLHHLALLEVPVPEEARHPRADLHLLERLDAADELRRLGDRLPARRHHDDGRRRLLRRGLG